MYLEMNFGMLSLVIIKPRVRSLCSFFISSRELKCFEVIRILDFLVRFRMKFVASNSYPVSFSSILNLVLLDFLILFSHGVLPWINW